MAGVINIFMVFIIWVFVTAIIVTFVYRDANKRGMHPLVWALVAALVPLFLGLIVYLICRTPIVELQCPRCGAGIPAGVSMCPQCKNPLLTECPNCGFPVQRGWKTCPKCGDDLPEDFGQPVRSYKKDNGIFVIIIILVLIMLALALLAVPLFSMNRNSGYSHSYSGYEGMYNITKEDMAENEALMTWITECDKSDKDIHVLLSDSSDTCIIYLKNSDNLMSSNISMEYHENGSKASIYVENSSYMDNYGYDFFLYEFSCDKNTDVTVYVDGYLCDAVVTTTDADISWDAWGGQ